MKFVLFGVDNLVHYFADGILGGKAGTESKLVGVKRGIVMEVEGYSVSNEPVKKLAPDWEQANGSKGIWGNRWRAPFWDEDQCSLLP